MSNQIDHDEILDSYIVKEIRNGEYRIRVDLETRIAGIFEFTISHNKFVVNFLGNPIIIENYKDFAELLQLIKYKLLDEEYDPYKLRKILRYLENQESIITSIISSFRRALET